jgi:hypothetical protein
MTRRDSAHVRYRQRLEAVTGEVERRGWKAAGWRRLFERFEPDREPYATCVFAAAGPVPRIVRIDAFGEAPGWFAISRVPPDPGLPTLPLALRQPGPTTIVRYHPGKRCTVRVEANGRSRFAKLYGNGGGERAHADGVALWRSAERGGLGFAVARPGGFDRALGATWQEAADGEPVAEKLRGTSGEEVAWRIGRAAASLPRSPLRPSRSHERPAEISRAAARCGELERLVPELAEATTRFLTALQQADAACGPRPHRPVHGALHPSQWLDDGERLTLLDYDSLALAEPELDAATFLADLDVENRDRVPVERLGAGFLAGYEEVAGPLDRRLLAVYRAGRRLEKALRVARTLRPDGDRKAARRLRRALECLEESP